MHIIINAILNCKELISFRKYLQLLIEDYQRILVLEETECIPL